MASVAVFHSILGLRPVERAAAERLRAAGHEVVAPDLFGGRTAETLDDGFRVVGEVGWAQVAARARLALADLPGDTALLGVSMGTEVVAGLWAERPAARAVLLHAAPGFPVVDRPGSRVQLHAADPDGFAPPQRVAALARSARESGFDLEVCRYPGAGHFYTDPSLPDHDPAAAELTWSRVLDFLAES